MLKIIQFFCISLCSVFTVRWYDVLLQHVAKLLYCFATAFRRMPKSPSLLSDSIMVSESNVFNFNVALEFKELDVKGNFTPCPKDKNVFKLRCNVEKRIVITIVQTSHGRELKIDR
jgi:Rab GTPase-activating protein 1